MGKCCNLPAITIPLHGEMSADIRRNDGEMMEKCDICSVLVILVTSGKETVTHRITQTF